MKAGADRIHFVVIEDNPDFRAGLIDLLTTSGGYTCAGAYENGKDALSGMSHPPTLLLLDLGLPDISGIEVLVQLKVRWPALRVLVITVFDNDDTVFEALKAGADGYLLKKETPAQMLDAIEDLLHGGAPMSREIARRVLASFREKPGRDLQHTLTLREIALLEQLSKGYLYKEIAVQLDTSLGTVKQYLHRIYEKLQVQNRTEALNRYWGRI